jgi:hypothetical protein
MSEEFTTEAQVFKVNDELGLVFGFGIVSTEKGEPYFDKQGDHIPEDAMLEAATDFMLNSRVSGDMHEKDEDGNAQVDGQVVFAFPLTSEVAKAFEIETPRTGLMVAIKPSPDVLAKFKEGQYTGFSIGGTRIEDEEVSE